MIEPSSELKFRFCLLKGLGPPNLAKLAAHALPRRGVVGVRTWLDTKTDFGRMLSLRLSQAMGCCLL